MRVDVKSVDVNNNTENFLFLERKDIFNCEKVLIVENADCELYSNTVDVIASLLPLYISFSWKSRVQQYRWPCRKEPFQRFPRVRLL
jgi:hypothetical protein